MKPYDAGKRLFVTWVEASGWKSLLIVAPSALTSVEPSGCSTAVNASELVRTCRPRVGDAHGSVRHRSREASSSSVVPSTPPASTTSRASRVRTGERRSSGSTTSSRQPPPGSRASRRTFDRGVTAAPSSSARAR